MSDLLQLQPDWLDAQCPRTGRYVLGPLLGKGGMGEVLEAWDMVLCRTVALKILRDLEPTALIRFMHEAQIQARIVHPNICRVYDVDSSEGTVKIAMQLVRGSNLEQAARDLTVEQVVTIMAQVADAVHAAHRLKLIHRDLKPSNILLERSPEGVWTPYICDFGLAMAMDEPALTYSHGVMGTPAYMAPEQLRGDRGQIGPGTDVYGLGGTLHFALLGKIPSGPSPSASASPSEPAVALPAAPGSRVLPRALRTIIHKCLEADPALRYASAAALAEDLWRFLNGDPIQATRPGSLLRLWRRGHRSFKLWGTSLLALTLIGSAMGLEKAWLVGAQKKQIGMDSIFDQEVEETEKDLRQSKQQPIQDIRPAYARARARMEAIRSLMARSGGGALGPGHLALARIHLMLKEFGEAQADLELARNEGVESPELFHLQGRTLAWRLVLEDLQGNPGGAPDRTSQAERLDALVRQGMGPFREPDGYLQALKGMVRKEYTRAAAAAHADLLLHPWHFESAIAETLSLAFMGDQSYQAGDLAGAEARYLESMQAARGTLERNPCEESVHHCFLRSAERYAHLLFSKGALSYDQLAVFLKSGEEALRVNPESPDLQADWLSLRILEALRLDAEGKDPMEQLEGVVVFLGTRTVRPLTPELETLRRIAFWQMAEQQWARGQDPWPSLGEALASPVKGEQGALTRRDALAKACNLKARVESAQGQDPRPTLEAALGLLEPRLTGDPSWTACEAAAEAWMVRADWEALRGMDAAASVRQALTWAERGLRAHPRSPSLQALTGLIRLLDARTSRQPNPMLLTLARERLRLSLAQGPGGRYQKRLQTELARMQGGRHS